MSLHCASLRLNFFYKLWVCGNPARSKSIAIMFSTSSAHFMSLCHILVILLNLLIAITSVIVSYDQWYLVLVF